MKRLGKDEELRRLAEKAQLHPLMPTKYNAGERAKLRKFEQELLNTSNEKQSKTRLVSPFATKEQEELFAKCAREAMNPEARLHWNEEDIER